MISQKKADQLERSYRAILYRRPIGIFSVLMLIGVCIFSLGLILSASKVHFPFYSLYCIAFSLLIIAISFHWLLQAVALLKKKDWSGVFMVCLGLGATYFGALLLSTCFPLVSSP
ncbi:MAG: hypothetical protein HZA31_09975 [Opitutae bacterium]|nr:hypothetical protein [Opitutae bacterium]